MSRSKAVWSGLDKIFVSISINFSVFFSNSASFPHLFQCAQKMLSTETQVNFDHSLGASFEEHDECLFPNVEVLLFGRDAFLRSNCSHPPSESFLSDLTS